MNRKCKGGNVLIKLDMTKATTGWNGPDFLKYWQDLVKKDGSVMFVQCLLTAGFQCSIMAVCMAKSSRGLRQGDPLAPSFLIIAEEVFSRGLLALYAAGAVKLHVPRGGPATSSHILFADDTIIFTNGSKRSLERLMESTSGQLINKALAAVLYCPNQHSGHTRLCKERATHSIPGSAAILRVYKKGLFSVLN